MAKKVDKDKLDAITKAKTENIVKKPVGDKDEVKAGAFKFTIK